MTAGVAEGPRTAGRPTAPHGSLWAARAASLFVLPYLVLGLVWALTNPPGASPDESDHLVKALAAGRLQIGTPYEGPPTEDTPILRRNASISRDLSIPADLAPDGFLCTAFEPTQTADCQPDPDGRSEPGMVTRTAAVGAYPVFGYVPLGWAALSADTPAGAFQAARVASLLMSTVLLFLAAWHLLRWLAPPALVGLVLAVTPMALFAAASVSTSGLEIMGAAAVAAVAVVATRRPDSLREGTTLAVLTVSGCALVLSRQLGAVTVAVLAVVVLTRGGLPVLWGQLRRARLAFLATSAALIASAAAVTVWELRYDHPTDTGPIYGAGATGSFFSLAYHFVQSGVGNFGYLDTPLPGPAVAVWIVLTTLVVGAALVLGRRADRWTVVAALVVVVLVAYATQAAVFYPIGAGLQGRHLLPLFAVVPVLSATALVERLSDVGLDDAVRRLVTMTGVGIAGLHLFAWLLNSRRYSVGSDGAILFFLDPTWAPSGGWWPWLAVATAAAAGLAAVTLRLRPARCHAPAARPQGEHRVER